jgi:hypothetical protein
VKIHPSFQTRPKVTPNPKVSKRKRKDFFRKIKKMIQSKEDAWAESESTLLPGGFNEDDGRREPEIRSHERGGVTAEEDDGGPDEGERPQPRREQLQERLLQ